MNRHATETMLRGFCFAPLGSGAEESVSQEGIFFAASGWLTRLRMKPTTHPTGGILFKNTAIFFASQLPSLAINYRGWK